MPRNSKQLRMKVYSSEKAKRAAELTKQGFTLRQIAKELGYASASGVSMLLEKYRLELPREALEAMRDYQLARLETVQRGALDELTDADPMVRDRARRIIVRAIEAAARISGTVKTMPLVVLNNPEQRPDLSRLSPEQLEALKEMKARMLEAPIEAHGEAVSDEQRSERADQDERNDADAGGGMGDREG